MIQPKPKVKANNFRLIILSREMTPPVKHFSLKMDYKTEIRILVRCMNKRHGISKKEKYRFLTGTVILSLLNMDNWLNERYLEFFGSTYNRSGIMVVLFLSYNDYQSLMDKSLTYTPPVD